MADTPNLDLLLMEVGAPNRELLVNAGLTVLDSTVAGVLALDVAGSGDLTLTDSTTGQAKHGVLRLSGVLTGARTVIVPNKGRRYLVENATTGAFSLTVKTAAGSGVAVPQGTWGDLVCDGTDVVHALGSAGGVTPGTPGTVARYGAAGTTLEATPLTIAATGDMGLRTATPAVGLHVVGDSTISASVQLDGYQEGSGGVSQIFRRARGSSGAPAKLILNDIMGVNRSDGWVRNAGDTADDWVTLGNLRYAIDSVDAQGRAGGRLDLFLSPGASAGLALKLRVSEAGNLHLGIGGSAGTGATNTLLFGPGVFPSTSPADTVQATAIDRGGTAGKRSLAIRTEDGTSHVLGDLSGIGTLLTATLGSGASYQALTVNGSLLTVGQSSVQERAQALLAATWVVSTDATRTARLTLSAYDATAAREGVRVEADGSQGRIGFLGANAAARQTLPVAATDAATTQSLANAIRTLLLTFGLGQ